MKKKKETRWPKKLLRYSGYHKQQVRGPLKIILIGIGRMVMIATMADLIDPGDLIPALPLRRIRLEDGGRGEHYPFDAWADGKWRRAICGKDFVGIRPSSFTAALVRWGKRWETGVSFWKSTSGDQSIFFRISPLSPDKVAIRDNSYGPLLYNLEEERGYPS